MVSEIKTSVPDKPLLPGQKDSEDNQDFGTEQYVLGLVEFIKYSVSPLTIALQGEWGSGKTSLMNRLHYQLCEKGDFIGININTWEYSMLSTPEETVVRIIESLVKSLSKDDKDDKAIGTFVKWARVSGGLAFKALRETAKIVGGAAASVAIETLINNDPFASTKSDEASLSDLKKALDDSIDQRIKKGNKRGVLVFVDDLDRLNPSTAVEILELLKNIFSLNNCIFILAIDYEVVVKGLEPKFGKLSEKNEREFRSFFDKIIQVPFSLPVNSYKPEKYLLDKLCKINYLTKGNLNNYESLMASLSEIVYKTVGKNPRAIKRLLNSLSLINCISNVSDTSNEKYSISPNSVEGKIINFAIIAIQISYPRIYNMLATEPDYEKWNVSTAQKFNATLNNEIEDDSNLWTGVLSAVCSSDTFLKQHEGDIREVLNIIKKNACEADLSEVVSEFINRSSITGVGGISNNSENADYAQIFRKLHHGVESRIKELHPDWNFTAKNRGKNGGFAMVINGKKLDSQLTPHNLNNGRITVRVTVPIEINISSYPNIKHILDLGFKDALNDAAFNKMLKNFDDRINPLLEDNKEWFKGLSLKNRFLKESCRPNTDVWKNNKRLLYSTTYDFTVPYADGFEDSSLIETMTMLHEAIWQLHKDAGNL